MQIHKDENTGKILNLVFAWADEGKDLRVDVPIVLKGEDICPGLKKGLCCNFSCMPYLFSVLAL